VQDREQVSDLEQGFADGKLLYTMEQWCAFDREEEGSGSSGSSKDYRRRPCGCKEKGPWGQAGTADERMATRDDTCNNYRWTDHRAKDCHLPPRRVGKAHITQAELQHAALFSAHGCVDYRLPPRRGGQAHVTQAEEQDAALFLAQGCEAAARSRERVKGPSFPLSASACSA
jgi:hypothetical protein